MKIAVIGAGNVGSTLGAGWTRVGHEVIFGVRDPSGPRAQEALSAAGPGARAASPQQAASEAGVITVATPWTATHEALSSLGDLTGKVLLDSTNPLGAGLELTVGLSHSAGEQIARWAPGALVVKIFNSTGNNNMANTQYGHHQATMFYAGDDAGANAIAHRLAADLGFDPVYAGPLKNARLLEPLAALWVDLALMRGHGRDIAFIMHKRT